jgi:hypothetical protein
MDERATLEAGVRSASGFTARRAQMLLASADGQTTITIAHSLRCNDQTVRNAIHAFHTRALAALYPQSSRPRTVQSIFDARRRAQLRALLHQSPRTFGKPTSVWTLQLAAEISFAEGITPSRSVTRPSEGPSRRWASPLRAPSTLSPVPTQSTSGKNVGATG